jgi:hypothetical protein
VLLLVRYALVRIELELHPRPSGIETIPSGLAGLAKRRGQLLPGCARAASSLRVRIRLPAPLRQPALARSRALVMRLRAFGPAVMLRR